MTKRISDIKGQRFGRLIAIEMVGFDKKGNAIWLCKCDCGGEKKVASCSLRAGTCKSCGCLHREGLVARNKAMSIHGITRTRVYQCWSNMMYRCFNPKSTAWKNYGGRGITACEFIQASPLNLVALIGDMPNNMTLERQNNELGYCCGTCKECMSHNWPMNIKWATRTEQARNSRHTRFITINGVTKIASDWAKHFGKSQSWVSTHFREQENEIESKS